MNVKTLCLAILHDGEATGYEIRKQSTEGEYSYFVEASFGSIYPALARLEEEGLVTSRVEPQQGKPAKKVYVITEAGRKTIINSFFDDLEDDAFRSEFLLFARFAPSLPASLVRQRLDERQQKIEEKLQHLDECKDKYTKPGDAWVLDYGRSCLKSARDHIANHKADLVAIALPDEAHKDAAE